MSSRKHRWPDDTRRRTGAATWALWLALLAGMPSLACAPQPRWNLLLVTFDTTRADHIGAYGHARAATPTVDRLAAEGVLFRRAVSAVPITLPSHATILTGRYPMAHGVRDNGIFVLPEDELTLAEILAAAGYDTAAAIGGFPLVERFGIGQGFELFDDRIAATSDPLLGALTDADERRRMGLFFDERRAARVNEAVLPWLEARRSGPFFLWLHYYDPHQPLDPPPPYDELFAFSPYDGEIAYADESLGKLLATLAARKLLERTLVVFTADHGEGRGEHREETHSYLVYDSTQHVPLIVRPPTAMARTTGAAGKAVDERVGTVDIVPTVLDLLDVPIPEGVQGRSLAFHLDRSLPGSAARPHYAETLSPRLTNRWGELRALFDGRWKYIHGPRPELYDLEDDPRELRDLLRAEPAVAARLERRLAELVTAYATTAPRAVAKVDPEVRQRLLALGYLTPGEVPEVREELRSDGIPPQDRVEDVSAISRARTLLHQRRGLAAREVVADLLEEDPDNGFYLGLMAHAELELGKVDAAAEVAERIVALGFPNLDGGRLIQRIAARLALTGAAADALELLSASLAQQPSAEGFHMQAMLLAQQGNTDEELRLLAAALGEDPRYGPARVDLAIHHARRGDLERAAAELRRAIADRPYYAKGHYNLGAVLANSGRLEEALASFGRALEVDPDHLESYYALISVHLDRGARDEADALYARLAARAPASATTDRARTLLEASP